MIEYMQDSKKNVVGLDVIHDKVLDKNFTKKVLPALEFTAEKHHGHMRLLVKLDKEASVKELYQIWDEAKHGLAHHDDYERIAVVGALPEWFELNKIMHSFFDHAEIKEFDMANIDDAWRWIKH